MDWIWDNLQLIIVVAGSIAVWLNQKRREKNGEPADYDEDGIPDNRTPPRAEMRELTPASRDGSDPAQEERRRLIQEEIRRKIAERRGQPAPPLPSQAPSMPHTPRPSIPTFEPGRPVFREEPFEPMRPANPFETPPPAPPPPMPVPAREVSAYDDAAALERQRRLTEQLAELETARRQVRRDAQALAETGAQPRTAIEAEAYAARRNGDAATAAPSLRGLAADLRDPRALRRAMVLREVLDAPVALR
ncbi:MAG: hypothetical protein H7067_01470 [Burkholderiales bacterium]|nr:hypothetical protein [Opitutaceae bacterium]